MRVRRAPEAATVLHPSACAVGLIGRVGLALHQVLFFQAPLGVLQALRARPRNRAPLFGAAFLEPLLGFAQPTTPALGGRELLRQLIAAPLAVALVFCAIDGIGLGQNLRRDLLIAARRIPRRVGMDLRPVDRDHPDLDQPGLRAQRQHLPEQVRERVLVTDPEARDRRVIGDPVGGNHPERDVVLAVALDPPRRALPDRVGVQQQRHHHRRLVRRATPPVSAIGAIKRGQIELAHGIDHTPRQVILRQPLTQARRQQQHLLAITRQEVLRHPGIVLNPPDGSALCATATGGSDSAQRVGPQAIAAALTMWRAPLRNPPASRPPTCNRVVSACYQAASVSVAAAAWRASSVSS